MKVLVMRFIEGQKLNDTVLLNRPGFDQRALVKTICDGVAYQLYITGVFTGDPHPGNIMVAKRETLLDWNEGDGLGPAFRQAVGDNQWVPVLIDFGLTKRISTHMRLAFAKMVVSAEMLDYGGVLDAYHVSWTVVWLLGCLVCERKPMPLRECSCRIWAS